MSLAEPRLSAAVARPAWHGPRVAALGLALGLTLAVVATFAASLEAWTPAALAALPLIALGALWISGGAATALLGLFAPPPPESRPPAGWRPASRTAILVTLCGEEPEPIARALADLRAGLARDGLGEATRIFVLSDTRSESANPDDPALREARAFRPLAEAGDLSYRRRLRNDGRKPGNIGDWVDSHGADFDHMLVMDADSRMTPARIGRMIWQMDRRGDLGLLQAGIAIRPGTTRFGRHQRLAARLLSPCFGRGFAAWSGDSGNYWGHNAIMRVAAFRAARRLPDLSGPAPWGGMLLSHDFVEAAWIRRAGWAVALAPATDGSAEEAPQTLQAFHKRDRRWCQGNLQHLRLIAEPGLDPVSRLHLAMGVLSYLVAPVWLILVALLAFGGVPVGGIAPLAVVALALLLPKLCAVAAWWRAARTAGRRATILRASVAELAVSTVIAPLVMLRQVGAILAICAGRDCGWKGRDRAALRLGPGVGEALAGGALLALAAAMGGPSALWLAPVVLPLVLAPLVMTLMDRPA
jgi:membrane glycosyltransferase